MDERGGCYKSELTIREHFAAMAMQGLLANDPSVFGIAECAVQHADALLRALSANQGRE